MNAFVVSGFIKRHAQLVEVAQRPGYRHGR
jgi:hypothetical protein